MRTIHLIIYVLNTKNYNIITAGPVFFIITFFNFIYSFWFSQEATIFSNLIAYNFHRLCNYSYNFIS